VKQYAYTVKNIGHQTYPQAMQKELSRVETEIDQGQLSNFNMQEISDRAFNEMEGGNDQ